MKLVTLIICSFFLISCSGGSTGQLWANPTYKEKVETFLISEDGKKLVIIGNKYHYIFELDEKLKNILLSENKDLLKAHFRQFKVDKSNKISGDYYLRCITDNEEYSSWLNKAGFKSAPYRNATAFTYSGSISGQRYTANENITTTDEFNRQYTIFVEEPSSVSIGKILGTPVAVAADGLKLAAGLTLLPLALIFVNR